MDLTKRARTYQFENRTFTDEEINLIANQKGLVAISFKNCPINDTDIEKISTLPKLVNIGLEKTDITDDSLQFLSKVSSLKYLFIIGANINGEGLENFIDHKKLDTLWLDHTNLDDEGIKHLIQFKKLGIIRIAGTKVTVNGLMSLAKNHKLKVVADDQFSKKEIVAFEALQRKLNKKSLDYKQENVDSTKQLLTDFFNKITEWEKEAEKADDFSKKVSNQCISIFKKHCVEKERKGFRPHWISYSNGPNYSYSHHRIIDFEQASKNKVFLYAKDDYLNTQYRFLLIKKEGIWKIDEAYVLDSGWKKYGL